MDANFEDYNMLVHLAATDELTPDLSTFRTNLMRILGFDETQWKSDVAAEKSRLKDADQAKRNLPGMPDARDPERLEVERNEKRDRFKSRVLALSRGQQDSEEDQIRQSDAAWGKSLER